jgi:hypothetical protein
VRRLLCMAALGAAALAFGVAPGGAATNECRGLQVCVPVAGPWVVVPAGVGVPRPHVEFQLSCPKGYIVGGLDAELSDRAIDITFDAMVGSPVNPGISTSRAAVFVATYVATPSRLSSFRPHIGCVPATGGGRRTPTVASAVPPGHPTIRRVWTIRLSSGGPSPVVTRSCAAAERLVAASHAVGFYTKNPPPARVAASITVRETISGNRVREVIRAGAPADAVPAIVQIDAVCAGGR